MLAPRPASLWLGILMMCACPVSANPTAPDPAPEWHATQNITELAAVVDTWLDQNTKMFLIVATFFLYIRENGRLARARSA